MFRDSINKVAGDDDVFCFHPGETLKKEEIVWEAHEYPVARAWIHGGRKYMDSAARKRAEALPPVHQDLQTPLHAPNSADEDSDYDPEEDGRRRRRRR